MSSTNSHGEVPVFGGHSQVLDDAEKGLYDCTQSLTVLPLAHVDQKRLVHIDSLLLPISPIHEGITPFSSVTRLSLSWPAGWKTPTPTVPDLTLKKKEKPNQKISQWIVFQLWFNTYRKFFTVVTLLNLTGIVMAALDRFPYAENHLGALVLGNLLCAILWAPLCIKVAVTSMLQHIGGIHSGCALSGAGWLVFKIVSIIQLRSIQSTAVIATGIVTTVFVLTSVLSAFPWATWVFVILGNIHDIGRGQWRTDANSLLSLQELCVLVPWFTLREIAVQVEIPSPRVAVLRFDRGMQQGLLGRISRTSIMEYHAFGIISEGRKSPYHYMICGVQGDFTKNLVDNPPKTVWTRELKFAGVGHASGMFKRGIRICTGTGIGAALSTCIQSPNWFLIWIGSDQEKTFGPTITGLIRKHIEPERMILWDSKKRGGRPDTLELLKNTWTKFGAEVIFITSNMQGNDEMMQGCRAAGLHAFGTLPGLTLSSATCVAASSAMRKPASAERSTREYARHWLRSLLSVSPVFCVVSNMSRVKGSSFSDSEMLILG
ncbi:hypothetical protein V495_01764 [Pseudogymnoascus sp. VKM F-4514 (FW-929)]|nr:hypothetical protein V495_01764 [Pseudogymnoascus sp. VKM F-4514 (FW-929)]KFY59256.1 hypothetical protein V497_04409 [Pseudogymnoascus sp. VKM F-4516 (FW-969)]